MTAEIIAFAGAHGRRASATDSDIPARLAHRRRRRSSARDAVALAALIVVPSITATALFLAAGWAMWLHHGWLAAQLGPYGIVWAWGGYALTTGAAYAWVARRFPPAIVAAWVYVLFMVLAMGWAHVSFGPAAVTAAAGVAFLRLGRR